MYTASLARLHALGNISTSRLTAPSLALSPPQFMRVGAVAVGLGYGAVMGTFTGLVRHAHGSPPLGAETFRSSRSRREDHRTIAVKDRATIRGFLDLSVSSRKKTNVSLTSPSLPDLPPERSSKNKRGRDRRAGASRVGADASRVARKSGGARFCNEDDGTASRRGVA